MEKVLFKCLPTREMIEKHKKIVTGFIWFSLVFMAIVLPAMLYFMGLLSLTTHPLQTALTILILGLIFGMCALMYFGIIKNLEIRYEQMPEKELGYDPEAKTFTYKDHERQLEFKAADVEKWYIVLDKNDDVDADIFILPDEQPIVLEKEFNYLVHPYLKENKKTIPIPWPEEKHGMLKMYKR